jgi:vacuolar-type H+-ATPase subunit H
MAEGKIKNPTSSEIVSTFKSPEENIDKVVSHLPERAKDRILHIGSGKLHTENTAKDMISAQKSLEKKGLNSYISPNYDQAFSNIKSNLSSEKEFLKQSEKNQRLVDILKKEKQRSENERISAANKRESLRQESKKESEKLLNEKKKQIQDSYNDNIKKLNKEAEERRTRISNRIRGTVGFLGGAALVHGMGLSEKDILGSYIGKLLLGKKLKK